MAVLAYSRWLALGKPLQPAQPVRDIVGRLSAAYPRAAAAYQFSWFSNDDHYLADYPQDHTPFSVDGWPHPAPQWWVCATDVMHRPDLGVDCHVLARYWLAEARAGRMPWLKYMIWQATIYDVRYGWRAQPSAGHFDHIHLSTRTDFLDRGLGTWSPIPGGDEMDPQLEHDLAWRTLGIARGDSPIVIPARPGGTPEQRIVNATADRLARLETNLANISQGIAGLAEAVAAIGTDNPDLVTLMAHIQEALNAQTAAVVTSTADVVVGFGEGGAAAVRQRPGGLGR